MRETAPRVGGAPALCAGATGATRLLGLTGLDTTGPIETFVPPIAFAILFGLSKDYEVSLMSRIREEHVHGLATRAAVEHEMAAIGRVVVAAALIMGSVFAAFVLNHDCIPKRSGCCSRSRLHGRSRRPD